MATLSPPEERLVSSWLLQKMPPNAGAWSKTGGTAFARPSCAASLRSPESQMKLPQLSTGEVVNLQKQILDLQEQLRELSQLCRPGRQLVVDLMPRGESNVLVKSVIPSILARHSKHRGGSRQSSAKRLKRPQRRNSSKRPVALRLRRKLKKQPRIAALKAKRRRHLARNARTDRYQNRESKSAASASILGD